jgi:uncharacterized protein (DUF2267 family)
VRRIATREEVDVPHRGALTEAVLTTLGERITVGEVDDLIARLPVALHGPLKAGPAALRRRRAPRVVSTSSCAASPTAGVRVHSWPATT